MSSSQWQLPLVVQSPLYLELSHPLSPHKVRVSHFQPLIFKVDRYLAGWKACFLSAGGHLVLVNVVLISLVVYRMSSLLLPKPVVDAIEGR